MKIGDLVIVKRGYDSVALWDSPGEMKYVSGIIECFPCLIVDCNNSKIKLFSRGRTGWTDPKYFINLNESKEALVE